MVIPAEVRSALVEHAEAELPNEACGLIALRDVAERFFRAGTEPPARIASTSRSIPRSGFSRTTATSSPSSTRTPSPPRPSRTDVESIGLWEGKPYLILSLRTGELAGWTIADEAVDSLPLS